MTSMHQNTSNNDSVPPGPVACRRHTFLIGGPDGAAVSVRIRLLTPFSPAAGKDVRRRIRTSEEQILISTREHETCVDITRDPYGGPPCPMYAVLL
ncbi:hypothetical protein AFLA_003771 [Aspergillus flavus NRRL3357]|nr:hypothetical protein AFLA_003771 [Aspergillus flavus NRRL3357]